MNRFTGTGKKRSTALRELFVGLLLLGVIVLAGIFTQLSIEVARRDVSATILRQRASSDFRDAYVRFTAARSGYLISPGPWLLTAMDSALGEMDSLVNVLQHPEPRRPTHELAGKKMLEQATTMLPYLRRQRRMLEEPNSSERLRELIVTPDYRALASTTYQAIEEFRDQEIESLDTARQRVGNWIKIAFSLGVLGAIGLSYVLYRIYSSLRPLVENLTIANERLEREQQINEELIDSLREKNVDLDHFAYIASHDLQEPLRTVNNFIEVFQEDYGDQLDEQADEYFGFLLRATDRMRDLINNLLHFSRIGQEDQRTLVDLSEVVGEVLEALSLRIEENKAVVTVGALPTVSGFRIELFQLFQNLLTNALKFTKPGQAPSVSIYATETTTHYLIAVEDQGIGMSESEQRKIFRMFSRVNNPKLYDGEGIGLAFCRKIVELHGGILSVDSVSDGGSTFYFSLPRTVSHEEEISPHPTGG